MSRRPSAASLRKVKDEPVLRMHHTEAPDEQAAPAPDGAPSYRALLRKMQSVLGTGIWSNASSGLLLDGSSQNDPPTIALATRLEPDDAARRVRTTEGTAIDAFLDGIQRTSVITHLDGVPVVHAFVAAVIRQRSERRLVTWDTPNISRALYLPLNVIDIALVQALVAQGVRILDSAAGAEPVSHPLAYRRAALDRVALERERLEQELAERWNTASEGWLWVDGGVSGISALRASPLDAIRTFGVVKSHATLYGDSTMIANTLRLDEAERSAAFLIRHRVRRPVISWYLRLRTDRGGDPLHGLVRVEILSPDGMFDGKPDGDAPVAHNDIARITELADIISTWIIAERLPISLPDSRWDRLTYGVHDCERYLASLAGTH